MYVFVIDTIVFGIKLFIIGFYVLPHCSVFRFIDRARFNVVPLSLYFAAQPAGKSRESEKILVWPKTSNELDRHLVILCVCVFLKMRTWYQLQW